MRRLVVLIVLVRVFAGCARPTDPVYQAAWDGAASQFEVPPARNVVEPDVGGNGSGGGLGNGGGDYVGGNAGDYPVCTKPDQPNCCYDGQNGHPSGIPRCGWQRLLPSGAVTISALYKDDQKVTAPVALTLTSVSPNSFLSMSSCNNDIVGFVISGPGVEDGLLESSISHYYITQDGRWVYAGGGATVGLLAGRDTQATGDGGMAMPNNAAGESLCKTLVEKNYKAYVELFDEITFTIGGEKYTAKFSQNPNGQVTGYYAPVARDF